MKKLLYILIMTILMIHLVACGGDKEKTETASSSSSAETPVKSSGLKKIGGLEEKKKEKEQVITGYYKVDSMTMGEETYDRNMLEEIGMAEAIYLVLEEDGNGRMCFEEEAEITYDETQIYADGGGASYVWKGNTITIEIEGVTLVMLRSTEIPPEPGTVAAEGAFPIAFAEEISGDWHGMIVAEEGTGELESYSGKQFEIIGRFVFHEDGSCTSYLASPLSNNSYNFNELSASYNEYGDVMMLEGEFFQTPIIDSSNAYVWNDVLYVDIYLDDEEGNTLNLNAGLRHLHEDWDYTYDSPALPEDAVKYYQEQGMDFLEMVEFYGLDSSLVPEESEACI